MTSTNHLPFHVLFLPGASTSRDSHGRNAGDSPFPFINRDDYLTRRFEFWKKKASNHRMDTSDVTEYPVSDETMNGGGDDQTMLRRMVTPLELALVECCERLPSDCCQSTLQKPHRSRLHRPIRPSNYDEDLEESDDDDNDNPPNNNSEKSSSEQTALLQKSGILTRGRECHFLSLLCMHCTASALGHRGLALAILQRSVDWEASEHKSNNSAAPSYIIQHFLEAGGMKLLARWLVDSFTASSSSKGRRASPTGSLILPILQLLKSIPFNKEVVVASQIHKIIKRLKKAIDTLVEGLDPNQLKQKHPLSGGMPVGAVWSALDELMSVWKQAAAADLDASNDKKHDIKAQPSPFDALQKELQSRFDSLATLQNEGGVPPPWLPTSISSIISGKSNILAMHANSFKSSVSTETKSTASSDPQSQPGVTLVRSTQQRPWYEPIKKEPGAEQTRTWEKLMSRKRKEHATALDGKTPTQLQKLNHNESSKRVTWADRPLVRTALPAPLAEVRVFTKDVYEEAEEEEMPQHLLGLCGDEEEGTSSDVAVKQEAVDDSELEDLCLDPDIADMF